MSNQNSNNNSSGNSRESPIDTITTIADGDTIRSINDKIGLLVEKMDQYSAKQEALITIFNEIVLATRESASAMRESASAMRESASAMRQSAAAMKESSDALKELVDSMRRLVDYCMGLGGRRNQINKRKLN